ncbi:MAG: Tricarboxylate transport protein TctC [Paucimonas sp.]|nr:Tricarboxylate transport protein TctC [Paucimonas sp.]
MKRIFARLALAMAALSGASMTALTPAHAQAAATGPSKIVVGFVPGGSNDIIARMLSEHLSKAWNQPVIVENKPGANASIASNFVAAQPPDGTTLLVTPPSSMIIEAALRPSASFDPARDLVPVSGLAVVPYVLVVNPSLPVKNVAEFIKLAKSKPGEINYGWANPGMRIATELFSQTTGVKLFPVGYKGSNQATPALLSGEVQALLIDVAPMTSLIKAGKLRALAVSTPTRTAVLPDVPTMRESGVDFEWSGFMALYAPKNTPPQIVTRINRDVATVLKRPDVTERLLGLGVEANPLSPQGLAQFLDNESKRVNAVLKAGNFKLD